MDDPFIGEGFAMYSTEDFMVIDFLVRVMEHSGTSGEPSWREMHKHIFIKASDIKAFSKIVQNQIKEYERKFRKLPDTSQYNRRSDLSKKKKKDIPDYMG